MLLIRDIYHASTAVSAKAAYERPFNMTRPISQDDIDSIWGIHSDWTEWKEGSASMLYVGDIWAVLREKVPNVLSHCHTKRRTGAGGRARPWRGLTPTIGKKKKKNCPKKIFLQKK